MKLHKKIIIYVVLIIIAALFLAPVYGILTLSVKEMPEIMKNPWGIPKEPTLENFTYVWGAGNRGGGSAIKIFFANSFKITIPAVIFIILFSLMAAYPLSKFKIKGQNIILALIIFGITIPYQVLIIPVFRMLNYAHLYDTIYGLIIIYIGYGIPFATFLLRNYMVQIPKEIIDSAMVDGASHYRLLFKIIFPLCKPAIAVLAILHFTWIFNEFFYGLILTNSKNAMPAAVAVGIINADSTYSIFWNNLAASSLILTLPPLIIFLAFQRYFIRGILLGSVKG